MHTIVNTTPFVAGLDVFPDRGGVDTLHVTLKAEFRIGAQLAVADVQAPIFSVDEYGGAPGASSLRRAGERHLACPGTAVVVVGSAHAPRQRAVPSLDVRLKLAGIDKTVRVHGDRRWRAGAATSPEPFTTLPLVFERALGGPDDPRNPVGVGFRGGRDAAALADEPLPNLEDPHRPYLEFGDRGRPACFAPVAPQWMPRQRLAGTYDEAWRRTRAPYLPENFDPRFFHAAPADQISARTLVGGEPLTLINATPEPLQCALPTVTWDLHATLAGAVHPLAAVLESVVIAPDELRLTMLWRAVLAVDRRALAVDAVTVDLRSLKI